MTVTNEQLTEHAEFVREFMTTPGGLVGGPAGPSRQKTPEEKPYSPSSKELRRLDPAAWTTAAMDLFRATGGTLSLAFMPTNETEWQIGEAWAALRLASQKRKVGVMVRLVWPDGHIEEIEPDVPVKATTVGIEVRFRYAKSVCVPAEVEDDVVTSFGFSVPSIVDFRCMLVHRFRRIRVGNVDTGDIHELWMHLDTDVHVVKRVVDAVAAEKTGEPV